MIPASSTEYSTNIHCNETSTGHDGSSKSKHIVITFDLAIYMKAKEVQESTGTAYILDGMAHRANDESCGAQSFGKLAEKYYQYITSHFNSQDVNRVDVVFDRYNKPYSIKGNGRERRGASSALEIKSSGPALQS